ncbi:MAG: hypothetical protein WCE63_04885 [Acidobacteriaceae bacterium]
MVPEAARENNSRYFVPFLILLAFYCIWILTLPLFPSLDGSLHLYYASVLGSLLSGSKDFASYYFIRHILPPYALHYYFLIAVAHFFGYVMADKLLVCLIFVTTAFGFRYLARFLGPSGDLLSLLIIPLLLNWPLGMGFYNYCLAIGMALWALGFWYRAVEQRSHRLWLAFLAVVILMTLTHPVPLVFIYVLVGADVGWRLTKCLQEHRSSGRAITQFVRSFRWDLLYMLTAWSTFGYIALFIVGNPVSGSDMRPRPVSLLSLVKLSTLAMFSGDQAMIVAYRMSLYILLFLMVALASSGLMARLRNKKTTLADWFFICSVLLLIVIPILPGSNFIAQRLVILIWIGTLAAASGHLSMPTNAQRTIALCACGYAIAVLVFANTRIRPVAVRIVQVETVRVARYHLTGLVLGLPNAPDPVDLDYFPYYWAGARYFRRTKSIMLNGGWLYEYYFPLGSNIDKLSDELTPTVQDAPGDAYQLLLHSSTARNAVLPHTNLLVFTGNISTEQLRVIVKELDQSEPSRSWVCESRGWYSDCTAPFASSVE